MTKLNTVRKGDRAEYITQGILSALGYSIQILRQEDFGIDFLCTLTERDNLVSYPTKSFTIQLKTSHDNIVYKVKENNRVKWLLENNLPFFICYFNNSENSVDFYCTALLNKYIISKPDNVSKISFRMENEIGSCTLHLGIHNKERKIYQVELGKPFLSISINDLSNEAVIEDRKIVLNKVVSYENENIVYRNLNLPFMRWLHKYDTNSKIIHLGWVHFTGEDCKTNSTELLKSIGHIIMSLCYAYKEEGKEEEYKKLREFVLKLPFDDYIYNSSLINMGFRDNEGEVIQDL